MNTKQTSENIFTHCILNNEDQLKTYTEVGVKIFKKNPTRLRWERTFS